MPCTFVVAVAKCVLVTALTAHPAHHHHPPVYKIHPGDTLSKIAKHEYGRADLWPSLWWINRKRIKDPNMIRAGQKVRISTWHPHRHWLDKAALEAIAAAEMVGSAPTQQSAPAPPGQSQEAPGEPVAPDPAPVTSAPASGSYAANASTAFEACVIQAESGGDPTAINKDSGASGLYGFLLTTWLSTGVGYPGGANTAPVGVQKKAFDIEYARNGVAPWRPYDGC